ncbi:efflux RND transporter periplasmic adaptor subunit [Bryobacter aggregatus]|uniref:efflux RND transporter periplasmic adaptor subunit n=1 Tax=Bryobacter aggregatus TaxID=360054 RepID=UPI0004E27DFE|nr:efflux RND transporter periplasmic adaptor subunit [Bryobacter aggregatus]
MKTKWKVAIGIGVLAIGGVAAFANYKMKQNAIIAVTSAVVTRQDLVSLVTASGEIKPRNYINIGSNANAPSRITDILVVEGQRVKKGQLLAKLESVQPEAQLAAQRANVASSEAESTATEAGLKAADENIRSAQASIERAEADASRAKLDYDRAEQLYKEKLIARQDYELKKSAYESNAAAVREAQARVLQLRAAKAQQAATLSAAQRRVTASQANLRSAADVLQRTMATSPIDGVVTNLPVRVGETVVPGIQNSAASLIMTIADMSIITAEVKVDETDIVNVALDQRAEITIDAIPGKKFTGKVIEIGNTAILRSTGLAASQSAISSQEAKDFKVVIALENPPEEIRPGLSCTSRVTTATRPKTLAIPIQALTVRQKGDLAAVKEGDKKDQTMNPAQVKAAKEEVQGVFVVKNGQAVFQKVETGITGTTDIEVTSGLTEGQEIITGSYKVIRTLRNDAKVKVDNKTITKAES